MAAAAARTCATIGKKELADRLGWSRPKLDRRLTEDKNFPVESRGDQSGGWCFDLAKVKAHLGDIPAAKPEKKPPALDKAQLRDVIAPPPPRVPPLPAAAPRRSAHHGGEATARQRKDEADAAMREAKLGEFRGELIERAKVRAMLLEAFAQLAQDMESLPEELARKSNGTITDAMMPDIRDLLDKSRRELHRRLTALIDNVAE